MIASENLKKIEEIEKLIKKVNQFLEQFENYTEDDLLQLGGYAEKVLGVLPRLSAPQKFGGKITGESYSGFFERAADAVSDYRSREMKVSESEEELDVFLNPDKKFEEILTVFSGEPVEIFCKICDNYNALPYDVKSLIQNFIQLNPDFIPETNGKENKDAEDYIKWRGDIFIKHREEIREFYNQLADDFSKLILVAVLKLCVFAVYDSLIVRVSDDINITGYDSTVIELTENDIVVEYDAEDGAVMLQFVENFPEPKKYYAYSPKQEFSEQLSMNLFKYDFQEFGEVRSEDLAEKSLDCEEFVEEPSFLRINKNAEKVLSGAKELIRKRKPKMSIDIWNHYTEIYRIPTLLNEIQPGYKLTLQYKGGTIIPTELFLLAVYDGE